MATQFPIVFPASFGEPGEGSPDSQLPFTLPFTLGPAEQGQEQQPSPRPVVALIPRGPNPGPLEFTQTIMAGVPS